MKKNKLLKSILSILIINTIGCVNNQIIIEPIKKQKEINTASTNVLNDIIYDSIYFSPNGKKIIYIRVINNNTNFKPIYQYNLKELDKNSNDIILKEFDVKKEVIWKDNENIIFSYFHDYFNFNLEQKEEKQISSKFDPNRKFDSSKIIEDYSFFEKNTFIRELYNVDKLDNTSNTDKYLVSEFMISNDSEKMILNITSGSYRPCLDNKASFNIKLTPQSCNNLYFFNTKNKTMKPIDHLGTIGFSSDSKKIAFETLIDNNRAISIMNTESGEVNPKHFYTKNDYYFYSWLDSYLLLENEKGFSLINPDNLEIVNSLSSENLPSNGNIINYLEKNKFAYLSKDNNLVIGDFSDKSKKIIKLNETGSILKINYEKNLNSVIILQKPTNRGEIIISKLNFEKAFLEEVVRLKI